MSISIEQIDTNSKKDIRRFTNFPFRLYANEPHWVPPIRIDHEGQLYQKKHPFYEHSDADFFVAIRDGQVVGRICALVNHRFNEYHHTKQAQFFFFDCEQDSSIALALFASVYDWAAQRGLDTIVGPKGMGAMDGYGLMIEGYQRRPNMSMLNFSPPYYRKMIEAEGFEKEVDFLSCYMNRYSYHVDERIHKIAERVVKHGKLQVKRFNTKRELVDYVPKIGQAYNRSFVNNWEYYPLSDREIKLVLDSLLLIADPSLIKIITHEDEPVGFVLAMPDITDAVKRSGGRLLPFGLPNMLLELRRTRWVTLLSAGILPAYHGIGGNALLYSELEKTLLESRFENAELIQVAETAVTMRQDLINIGAIPFKVHRVFHKHLSARPV
jgi:hypothetical protein